MEILIFIVVVALFVWLKNSLSSDMERLGSEIKILKELVRRNEPIKEKPVRQPEIKPEVKPSDESQERLERILETVVEKEIIPEEKPQTVLQTTENLQSRKPEEPAVKTEPVFEKAYPPAAPPPSFFEKHPDLEKFIGENLINKIGIGILVLGIAFFVKYAMDKNWINEIGRVCIGIFAGGVLIAVAHRLRGKFKAFSSVLIGGGLSVLYFTIAIAFHQYHLFTQEAAFIIMVVITSFAVVLSIAYDRIEMAVLALIGGFSTPFILSTGEGNYKILFSYLMILNSGMLVLAYLKKWNLVNILCYLFTILIYGSWLVTKCLIFDTAPYQGAFLFATSFYLIFFFMNTIYNIKNKIKFKSLEISILLSNAFLYYAAGMSILLYFKHTNLRGVFTALIAVFNFGFAFAFYKKENIDRNLIFLLIGLVLTFVSLTAPIQLEGHYITLFWSAEAVVMLWLSQKSGIKLIKGTSAVVMILMLISLMMDWENLYGPFAVKGLSVVLNKAFITSIVSVASVFLTIKLLNKEEGDFFVLKGFKLSVYVMSLKILFITLLYGMFFLELNYQLMQRDFDYNARNICVGIYNFTFLASSYLIVRKNLSHSVSIVFLLASGLCLLLYLMIYNESIINARDKYLETSGDGMFFLLHFILAVLVVAGIYIFNTSAKRYTGDGNGDWVKWITVFLIVFLSSAELSHVITWLSYSPGRIIYEINRQVFKTGYSVLWGVISFVLMQQGMLRKDRALRIISLSLFFITIVKLFTWDIKGISEGGKVIAFISLGILLLVVSFMYQRLKGLILESETANNNTIANRK